MQCLQCTRTSSNGTVVQYIILWAYFYCCCCLCPWAWSVSSFAFLPFRDESLGSSARRSSFVRLLLLHHNRFFPSPSSAEATGAMYRALLLLPFTLLSTWSSSFIIWKMHTILHLFFLVVIKRKVDGYMHVENIQTLYTRMAIFDRRLQQQLEWNERKESSDKKKSGSSF